MRIYFDHNATTPVDEAVLEEMLPYFKDAFGNPSSIHSFGQEAKRALDLARERVAGLIGAEPDEVVFTSGGTESNNLAIKGAILTAGVTAAHIVTSAVEHNAILEPLATLEKDGARVTRVGVDGQGRIDPEAVEGALSDDTVIVSIMLANNDVGTVQPIREICERVKSRGVRFHCDAVQGAGKIDMDVKALGVDLASFSSHKIYGPKGVGALYVGRGAGISPLQDGGRQESGRRGGTENIPAIVGFGKACEVASERYKSDAERIEKLRDRLQKEICGRVENAKVHGAGVKRLPGTLNVSFKGVEGDALVMVLDLKGVAVSTGAACSSTNRLPSHVLTAMGCTDEEARSAIRISLGRANTLQEVETAAKEIETAVTRLR